ncbi:MAG: hypothetical protein U0353_17520 [Sandaracinus sp.]
MTGVFNDEFFFIGNHERRAYGLVGVVLEYAATDRGLDLLMKALGVKGKPGHLKKLDPDDKAKAILHELAHLAETSTSMWHRVHTLEILTYFVYEVLNKGERSAIFGHVAKESDLLRPVAQHFADEGYEVYDEIPMGRNRADLVAHKPGSLFNVWSPTVVAVELKNDLTQLKRGIDQLTTFQDYAHETYLACTPAIAHEYLRWHAKSPGVRHWDSDALKRKLNSIGETLDHRNLAT